MEIIASLLEDMGFKKVCGILDKDKEQIRDELTVKFPKYKFFSIPALDVRTKGARAAKESVLGLLDEKQKLRDEYKKGVEEIMTSINEYLCIPSR